jgi:hypothetical protein
MKYESPMNFILGTPVLEKDVDLPWFMSRVGLEWEDDSTPDGWENPWHRAQMQEFQIKSFGRTWALQ